MDYEGDSDDQLVEARTLVRPYARESVKDRFPDYDERRAESTLYARCIISLGTAAAEKVGKTDADSFRWDQMSAITSFVDDMYGAVADYDKADPNFWRHDQFSFDKAKRGDAPPITRDWIEGAVDSYIALPVRSSLVDRTLVDILLATELYAFASEAFGNKYSYSRVRIVKGNGPLGFFVGRGCSILLFGVLIALVVGAASLNLLSEVWMTGLIILFLGLLALETIWAIGVLPFAWRAQVRNNAKIGELLSTMNGVYTEMNTTGSISAKHIRERAQAASAAGIGWPAPLFVLLDDIILREGRM